MRNIIAKAIMITISVCSYSCVEVDNVCCLPPFDESFTGQWLLYETGYSPGGTYIVNEVPLNPPQKIILISERMLTITVQGLEDYTYYKLLDDPNSEFNILALYKTDPGNDTPDISKLEHSYVMSYHEGSLKLSYRWCIEGCHMAFKRSTE
jgi:hypothetical protein